MQASFSDALKAVLQHEGGYSDHPEDPGGATNRGITFRVFQNHHPHASLDDLRSISDSEVSSIYRSDYWDKCRCDELPIGVDYVVFDAAVNSGPTQSARWLQRAVGATDDGLIGRQTITAAVASDVDVAIQAICRTRLEFLQGLST